MPAEPAVNVKPPPFAFAAVPPDAPPFPDVNVIPPPAPPIAFVPPLPLPPTPAENEIAEPVPAVVAEPVVAPPVTPGIDNRVPAAVPALAEDAGAVPAKVSVLVAAKVKVFDAAGLPIWSKVTVQVEPSVHVFPFTVVPVFVSPELFRVPDSPSWTLPALGFENVSVNPFVAAEFSKLTVALDVRVVPLV